MTWPVTPLASVHFDPTALATMERQFRAAYTALMQIFEKLPAEIIEALVNVILTSFGYGSVTGDVHTLISALESALLDIPQGNITGLVSDLSTAGSAVVQLLRDAIATALGHPGTGHTDADILSYLENIPGTVISGVIPELQNTLDAIAHALGVIGTGHTASDIQIYLQAIPGGNIAGNIAGSLISGATTVEQQIVDAIANALGHPGTGHTPADILIYLANIPASIVHGVTADWATALGIVGIPTPTSFVQLLHGLFPAAISLPDGAVIPTAISGFVDNLNGTWQYTAGQTVNDVSHLIQQVDGTIISVSDAVQQQARASIAAGAANVGVAISAGQQMVDHGIAAIQADVVQVGQAAQDFGTHLASAFTSWWSAISGAPAPPVGAPPVGAPQLTQAQLDAAARAAAQAQQTAAIQAQLPHFYGGSGTAGLSAQVALSGTLPGSFTQILPGIAKYTAPFLTDSQEVSGVWNTVTAFGKYLVIRANATFTDRVYAFIKSGTNACEIGYYNGGVKTPLGAAFTLPGGNMQANAAYSFQATDYAFTLTGPGGLSVTVTDSLHNSQKNALHCYGGFGTEGAAQTTQSWFTPGTPTFNVPAGFTTGDKFIIGDLGSGGGGMYYTPSTNHGGCASAWASAYLTYGTDIPLTTTAFPLTVPAGGLKGLNGVDVAGNGVNVGGAGSPAVVSIAGYGTVTSAGGSAFGGRTDSYSGAAAGGAPNASAPTHLTISGVFMQAGGVTFFGDGTSAVPIPGSTPGGGGPVDGVTNGYSGGPGGPGGIYITPVAVNTALPDGLVSFTIFDSGPSAGPATATVLTQESTTSTTYVDLATTTDQVTVTIGLSGLAIVLLHAGLANSAGNSGASNTYATFEMSGANTSTAGAAGDINVIEYTNVSFGYHVQGSPFLLAGLNPGATTFKMKYRVNGNTGFWSNRSIAVIPL